MRLVWKLFVALLVMILLAPFGLIYGFYYRGYSKMPDLPEPPATAALSDVLLETVWVEFEGGPPIEVVEVGPLRFTASVLAPLLREDRDDRRIPRGFKLTEWCAERLVSTANPDLVGGLEYGLASLVAAIRLSSRWSTPQIAACVLERSYSGRGFAGIRAAAEAYFGKAPGALERPEAALLVVLARAPARFDPICYPKRAREGRNALLTRMTQAGMMDPQEAGEAAPLGIRLRLECG